MNRNVSCSLTRFDHVMFVARVAFVTQDNVID